MKVLFAVNDENISAEIVKKYQKEYKEIISYKNVYFYNAILKELQRDKSYDRIVISEDLEEFTSSSYEQRDKFIFEKLDQISDEAQDTQQENISIILICSERRSKSDDILVKLFGIGIYNAIIGNDRSVDQVCNLINKPRSKKQAKIYYNIETEEVNYKPENENEVNEEEMRNILNHFKKLGKNEDQYVQSFNNIVSQYNEKQLKIIMSVLPLNVKAVLEEKSPEYKRIAMTNGLMSGKISSREKINKITGPSEKLLLTDKLNKTARPVVVPTTMKGSNIKKVVTQSIKPAQVSYEEEEIEDLDDEDFDDKLEAINEQMNFTNSNQENIEEPKKAEEKTKRRGRPRKNAQDDLNEIEDKPKRRGRPKKQEELEDKENNLDDDLFGDILPGFNDESSSEKEQIQYNNTIDNFEEEEDDDDDVLPGFEKNDDSNNYEDEEEEDEDNFLPQEIEEDDEFLPQVEESKDDEYKYTNDYNNEQSYSEDEDVYSKNSYYSTNNSDKSDFDYSVNFDKRLFESLLTPEKKIVAFLGTTKNGTSFIVNAVAEVLSNLGVNVAILDTTKNKNSYYIYTKNEESLRQTALNSFQELINGNPYGVKVNQNLTVYTGIPSETENIKNFGPILQTLVQNHTCILIDCDFDTPDGYFDNVQELFLVQSMDILTIQPLTLFLRNLKSKNILDENKINIVLNKVVKLRGITTKNIIGGMAFYNDPEMSFMTELFDKNTDKYTEVPFNEEVYTKYLSGIVDCEISTSNYPKEFKNILQNLAQKVYTLAPRQAVNKNKKGKASSEPSYANRFSNSMNNTLNNMKKNY